MVTQTEVFFFDVERIKEVTTEASPVLKPFKISAGLAEEFKLHLFKFTHTENEVTGSNFVTEALADLCNAERNLLAACSLNVREVYKNTLSGFGTKVNFVLAVLGNTLKCLEHKIELTNVCKIVLAAVGAGNSLFFDVVHHLLISPACNVCTVKILDKVVGTVTCFTFLTVHKRVGKSAEVT